MYPKHIVIPIVLKDLCIAKHKFYYLSRTIVSSHAAYSRKSKASMSRWKQINYSLLVFFVGNVSSNVSSNVRPLEAKYKRKKKRSFFLSNRKKQNGKSIIINQFAGVLHSKNLTLNNSGYQRFRSSKYSSSRRLTKKLGENLRYFERVSLNCYS